jgi:predicted SAM-dependent methyltransferase
MMNAITKASEKYDIHNNKYQTSLKSLLIFEITSLYGRVFLKNQPKLKKEAINLLHLGCGITNFENWVNADFFVGLKFWKKYNNQSDWMLDLRFPFNCEENVWDGVFTEHTLEHLYPNQVMQVLKELHRTMKSGAWLRITVPDLKKYVSYYNGENVNEQFIKFKTGCEAIRSLTQDYGHVSLWDSELLTIFLKEAGFINIKEVTFMQGTNSLLLKDNKSRAWETLYIEAQKPLDIDINRV